MAKTALKTKERQEDAVPNVSSARLKSFIEANAQALKLGKIALQNRLKAIGLSV